MFKKVEKLSDLKQGNVILTVDLNDNESLELVKCVDNVVWTEGVIDGRENYETEEELLNEYKTVLIIKE